MTGLVAVVYVVLCAVLLVRAVNDKRGPRNVRLWFGAVFAVVLFADIGALADLRADAGASTLPLASLSPVPTAICLATPPVVLAVWTVWRLRAARVTQPPR